MNKIPVNARIYHEQSKTQMITFYTLGRYIPEGFEKK